MKIERPADPLSLPALTLAYLGDTVYDLYVRTTLAETLHLPMRALHLEAAKHVCAAGQANAYRRMADKLSEAEQAAFRRGRNAHSGTVPKHADVRDYRVATGLESLLGYLYLRGEDERIGELMRLALTIEPEKEPES
ncbi:MAG: Mini-ribonuclease 3 [Clostridia bacterium]|nr:Mini-ribonuclease 3 [Clostridia bacterium]